MHYLYAPWWGRHTKWAETLLYVRASLEKARARVPWIVASLGPARLPL